MIVSVVFAARAARFCIGLAVFLLGPCNGILPAAAQFQPPKTQQSLLGEGAGPAFSVNGFSHSFIPPETHMYECGDAKCGAGSRVSYRADPAKLGMTFAEYKVWRTNLDRQLRSGFGDGAKFKSQPPTQKKHKQFTIFESRHSITMPSGEKKFGMSRTVLSQHVAIELVGSSSDEKLVEGNLDVFTITVMTLSSIPQKIEIKP